jgi:hypothetical protein
MSAKPSTANFIVNAASIAEAVTDRSLDYLIEHSQIGATKFGDFLLRSSSESFHQTWEQRLGSLRRGFGVDLSGTQAGDDLLFIVETRNAIVHGQGSITGRQLSKPMSVIEYKAQMRRLLESDVRGTQLRFGPRATHLTLRIVQNYILLLDASVASAGELSPGR